MGGLSNTVSFIDARKQKSKRHGTGFEKHRLPNQNVEHQRVEDISVKDVVVPSGLWRLLRD